MCNLGEEAALCKATLAVFPVEFNFNNTVQESLYENHKKVILKGLWTKPIPSVIFWYGTQGVCMPLNSIERGGLI